MILYREMTEWHDHDHQPTDNRVLTLEDTDTPVPGDLSDSLIELTLRAWPKDRAMRQ